jgi:hypothetical protein
VRCAVPTTWLDRPFKAVLADSVRILAPDQSDTPGIRHTLAY